MAADLLRKLYDGVLRRENIYSEFQFKEMFFEGFIKFLCENVRLFSGLIKKKTVLDLGRYTGTLCRLNGTHASTLTVQEREIPRASPKTICRDIASSVATSGQTEKLEWEGS